MTVRLIGFQVAKISGKPFKSKLKINTVRGYLVHPITERECYIFEEDDSYVECKQCYIHSIPTPISVPIEKPTWKKSLSTLLGKLWRNNLH